MDANGLADLGIIPLGADHKPVSQNFEQQNKLKLNGDSVPSGRKFDINCPIEALGS